MALPIRVTVHPHLRRCRHVISNHSFLNLIRNGQHAWVQSFDIGHLGTTFFDRLPKGVEAPTQLQVAVSIRVQQLSDCGSSLDDDVGIDRLLA